MPPPPRFTLGMLPEGHQLTLTLVGELDAATAPTLDLAVTKVGPGYQVILLDLTGLSFCDSSGLAALVRAHRHLEAEGRHLALTAVPERIRTLMAITGLDQVIDIVGPM